MNRSMPGLPVHHQLPEFTQTQVHWVGDAIQPSHPLLSPSPPAPNPSERQGLSQWVNSSQWGGQSIGVWASASVFPMNTQDWSPLGWTGWISLQFKGLSRVFSTPQFKSIYILLCKTDNQQRPPIQCREVYSIFCNNLHGKRIWKIKHICMYVTESHCCTPNTTTTL